MDLDVSKFRGAFFEEAEEHLLTMETTLVELAERPDDPDQLARIFRAAHSLKGASGTFGFTDIARLTHGLEEMLDELREGRMKLTKELTDLLLRCADMLRALLTAATADEAAPPYDHLIAEIAAARSAHAAKAKPTAQDEAPEAIDAAWTPAETPAAAPVETPAAAPAEPLPATIAEAPAEPPPPATHEVRVTFVPGSECLRTGMDPLLLLRDLSEIGRVEDNRVDLADLPPLGELDPETCHTGWKLRLVTDRSVDEVRDVFAFVEDTSRVEVDLVGAEPAKAPEVAPKAQESKAEAKGPAVVEVPKTTAIVPSVRPQPVLGTMLPGPRSSAPDGTPLTVSPVGKPAEGLARSAAKSSSLRVATEKIDRLVDLVGEVIIAHAMVAQALNDPSTAGAERLREAMATMDRNTRELQERVMAVRMVPVGTVFSRFPRLVHDLANALDKKISLELVGEDIELDKGMVEQLADPITHLVRNAVDHGIETPDDRVRAGKPETGVVRLSAFHTGGSVMIEVSDDGRGLQTTRIREKALANGLIRDDDGLSEEEVHQLIFLPGFTTAGAVTNVSGRGVGMDVVKRNVEAMNGTVAVASRPGAGSAMRIRLPLTMAVMDGLALRVGDQLFLLPLISIRESFRPKAAQVKTVLGRGEVVLVRDQSIPLVRLHEVFGIEGAEHDPARALVCIVETGSSRVGLMVDEPLGQSQVVVKSLESNFKKVDGIMGATIMGDGKVALILDATAISRQAARAGLTREARHGTDACAA